MMLADVPVPDDAVEKLASCCRFADADELADRLERALDDGVSLLALTIDGIEVQNAVTFPVSPFGLIVESKVTAPLFTGTEYREEPRSVRQGDGRRRGRSAEVRRDAAQLHARASNPLTTRTGGLASAGPRNTDCPASRRAVAYCAAPGVPAYRAPRNRGSRARLMLGA